MSLTIITVLKLNKNEDLDKTQVKTRKSSSYLRLKKSLNTFYYIRQLSQHRRNFTEQSSNSSKSHKNRPIPCQHRST